MNRLLLVLALALLARPAPAADTREPPEPRVERHVAEDDQVRIEELRVRGQTQSIVVKSKIRGIRPSEYEIVPPSAARDPSVAGQSNGQRVWHFFSF